MTKHSPRNAPVDASAPSAPHSKRRQLVVGAGVAAGAALAAAALKQRVEAPPVLAAGKPDATQTAGYRLTDHVLRYYETTRT
jgi:hypothetical protein